MNAEEKRLRALLALSELEGFLRQRVEAGIDDQQLYEDLRARGISEQDAAALVAAGVVLRSLS